MARTWRLSALHEGTDRVVTSVFFLCQLALPSPEEQEDAADYSGQDDNTNDNTNGYACFAWS